MNRPLYHEARDQTLTRADDGNAGLWWDKFCDRWKDDWTGLIEPEKGNDKGPGGKHQWLDTLTSRLAGNPNSLKEHARRRRMLAEAVARAYDLDPKLCWRELALGAPFATGLGLAHPVENGFHFDHTLGVPYLPGSGVKGVVGAWVERVLAARGEAPDWEGVVPEGKELDEMAQDDAFLRVFGHLTARQEAREEARRRADASVPDVPPRVGSVIFMDALPVTAVRLSIEVMTPHYGPWYQAADARAMPPADWYDPTPIPFLAVERGAVFAFGLLPNPLRPNRKGEGGVTPEQARADVAAAGPWLANALAWLGAGAKTATGFGRFDVPREASGEAGAADDSRADRPSPPKQLFYAGEPIAIVERRAGDVRVRFEDGYEEWVLEADLEGA